jgi:hypothetical protein
MNEDFDEPPVDLSPLDIDAEHRTQRIAARVSSRIERARTDPGVLPGIERVLARWAVPATLAAAASLAFVLLTKPQHEGDVFAAFVLSRGPAAGWIASGQAPDVAEVTTMIGNRP